MSESGLLAFLSTGAKINNMSVMGLDAVSVLVSRLNFYDSSIIVLNNLKTWKKITSSLMTSFLSRCKSGVTW